MEAPDGCGETESCLQLVVVQIFSPQVYPTGPGVHLALLHTFSVTPGIAHPDKTFNEEHYEGARR